MRRFSAVFACCVVASALSAQERMPWYSLDARQAALGGRHAALADYEGAFGLNPASLATAPPSLLLSRVSLQLAGPIFEIAGLAIEGGTSNVLAGASSFFDSSGRLFAAADLCGPINAAFISKGFGIGLYNRTRTVIDASSLASIGVAAIEDLYLRTGYGHGFKLGSGMSLELGAAMKGFTSRAIRIDTDIMGLTAVLENLADVATTEPLLADTGFSFDAGLRFSAWNGRFAVGVSGIDAFGMSWLGAFPSMDAFLSNPLGGPSTTPYILDPDLSAGILFSPPLGKLGRYVSDMRFMLDYSDILSLFDLLPRNPVLLLSAGAEVTFHDILHVRAGMGEGLFSAGFGVDLTIFTLNMAMFGRELGREPGSRPVYNLMIDMSFELF